MIAIAAALLISAASDPASADPEIDHALELFRGFKETEGIKVLGRALTRTQLPPSERARVYTFVAIGEANRGDDAAMRRALEQAFSYDPSVKLPDIANPKVRAMFEQIRPREVKQSPDNPQTPDVEPPVKQQLKLDPLPPPPPPPSAATPRLWWVAPAALAVAGAIVALAFEVAAENKYQDLKTGTMLMPAEYLSDASQGPTFQTIALVGLIAAGVFTVVAIIVGVAGS